MNSTFSKFNVYDQIGYLMVGGVALILMAFNAAFFYSINIPRVTADNFLVLFINAYFFGHLIQGIANIINKIPLLGYLIKENKGEFDKEDKEILKRAETYFGLENQDDKRIWNICYIFSSGKDITAQVQSFNAYYSMYRGWLVVFFLESLFLFYIWFILGSRNALPFFVLSMFLTLVFYLRSKRFWQYLRSRVLQTFIVAESLKL